MYVTTRCERDTMSSEYFLLFWHGARARPTDSGRVDEKRCPVGRRTVSLL